MLPKSLAKYLNFIGHILTVFISLRFRTKWQIHISPKHLILLAAHMKCKPINFEGHFWQINSHKGDPFSYLPCLRKISKSTFRSDIYYCVHVLWISFCLKIHLKIFLDIGRGHSSHTYIPFVQKLTIIYIFLRPLILFSGTMICFHFESNIWKIYLYEMDISSPM